MRGNPEILIGHDIPTHRFKRLDKPILEIDSKPDHEAVSGATEVEPGSGSPGWIVDSDQHAVIVVDEQRLDVQS